ncbi:tripartite tricarboxylate transporter permease [Roseomonas sp. AR75]|uniref:tripartite tricarboxylate transporter permease n=1 Tax=Roseomonas sp. AR75 TaxID=2562311 RepID=UPI0010C07A1A|nr:tripartite tricarboxylate transporter permease [Roseomonas sp. AR75]
MEQVLAAAGMLADPQLILVIAVACVFGLFVGAVPGLTATMATALMVPFTFFMEPLAAVSAIVACTAMAITAGDIPGCLIRVPGTPASAAYTDETYAMTRKGLAAQALGSSLVSSVIGGLFGAVVLMVAAPLLARIALNFSAFEYFWLAMIGLSCAAFVASADPLRGILALLIGLFVSTIGMDAVSGAQRFTFGSTALTGGLSFIPAMIGLFAVAEILRALLSGEARKPFAQPQQVQGVFHGIGGLMRRYWKNNLRGSILGTAIGALPGAGGDIAAWMSYATARKFSKTPEKFGTGHPEGVIEAGASNNAGLSGAWIPALVFGIPGDAVTAIAVGVLIMQGLNPGPQLFTQQAETLYAIYMVFILANLLLLPLGWLAIRLARPILSVPRTQLMAAILLFCVVGAFAINNSMLDIAVMLGFGVLGLLLGKVGVPVAPVILGMVLGPLVEQNFLAAMVIADGRFMGFFERPIAAALGVAAILVWTLPLIFALRRRGALRTSAASG